MDYVDANREKFEACIDPHHFPTWTQFQDKMRQRGTFADGTIVAAAALSFRQSIIIHEPLHRPILFKPLESNGSKQQIHLSYHPQNLHYDSLYSIDGKKLHIDDSECTFG